MVTTFYRLMHRAYAEIFGEQHMLHYPLFKDGGQDLMQGQRYFTDHCLSRLPDLRDKRLLDIGCGNGVQTIYIHDAYQPGYAYGVDISEMHVQVATAEKQRRGLERIDFAVDNAQKLASVPDDSFDAAICTESAHHYPDKDEFLGQVRRVLRPGGSFVIADLLRRDGKPPSELEKKLMCFHWPRERYLEAFQKLRLSLVQEEDMTDLILPGFKTSNNWFSRPGRSKGPAYYFSQMFAWGLIKLYVYQLTHTLQYQLIVGRKE